jgi:hypothetical protein
MSKIPYYLDYLERFRWCVDRVSSHTEEPAESFSLFFFLESLVTLPLAMRIQCHLICCSSVAALLQLCDPASRNANTH